VKFVKVDTDVHEETVDKYNIQGLPLFGLFIKGEIVQTHSGAMNKDALKEFVDSGLKKFNQNSALA
jgi:thioredoxin-like negative regulator of GroEL